MSMSTHVIGFRPPDEKWKKMKAVYDACKVAGIISPQDVREFFNQQKPDDEGVRVFVEDSECCVKWSDHNQEGFEINVKKLPRDVTVIRFYNAW